jgi:hypothetical protein
MLISVNVPGINVSNGRLISVKTKGRNKTFNWYVSNPINNYGVNINVLRLRFSEKYQGKRRFRLQLLCFER